MAELPHDVLIALHVLAGVVCFMAGALSLRVSTARSWRFLVYVVSRGLVAVSLGARSLSTG
jgi:hypothetical protein